MDLAPHLAFGSTSAPHRDGILSCLPKPAPTPSQLAYRYCVLLLSLVVLAIPACIRLGYSDFFLRHGASVWVQANDAVFAMRDRDCDVLIFGDSTAMTGIDPNVVERNTGFKTCNIAVTNAVLAVTRNLTLNHFLAHNGKPRLLLIQLSPDGFQPESSGWGGTIYPEGILELLRHGDPAQSRRFLLKHPQEAIAFAGYAAGFTAWSALKELWSHLGQPPANQSLVSVHDGFFTPQAPARKFCDPVAAFSATTSRAEYARRVVADYRRAYADPSRIVLVNVAPIPSCDRNLATFSSQLNGVTSNTLQPLPIGVFNDPRHYTADGSTLVSRLVSEELNAVAERNPQIDNRRTTSLASLRSIPAEAER
jgi:hypothetical protein